MWVKDKRLYLYRKGIGDLSDYWRSFENMEEVLEAN